MRLGNNAASIWKEMREGRSAIRPMVTSALHEMKGTVGTEIKELPQHDIGRNQLVSRTATACSLCLQRVKPCSTPDFPAIREIRIASARQWASAAGAGERSKKPTVTSFWAARSVLAFTLHQGGCRAPLPARSA
ncbi:Nodulation protein NodE [Mesorhizobium loti]|nr:Nodulation protein NodE [Mesorhizobium loti]